MAREPARYAKVSDDHGLKNQPAVADRTARTILALLVMGIACGLVASLVANGLGHASESGARLSEKVRDQRSGRPSGATSCKCPR
jgi:hypothetical protein